MKKNLKFMQATVMNEVLTAYTTRDIADHIAKEVSSKDVELSVYETHDDGIMFRKKKDGIVTDDVIIKAFAKAIRKLVEESEDTDHSIVDIVNDNHDFKYHKDYIDESYIASILTVRRSGRIISVEIDV